MLNDFYEKTTKAFKVTPLKDGIEQSMTGTTLHFIVKENKSDTDAQAKISKTSTDGNFLLTVNDTTIEPMTYFYEIKWTYDQEVYILESGKVTVKKRVFQ